MQVHEMERAVIQWQKRVNHPFSFRPRTVDMKEAELQAALLTEEGITEYLRAVKHGDLVEIADALGDALWIVLRGFAIHGMDVESVFNAIAASNYSKFDAKGKPVPHPTIPGKIGKSDRFTPPTEDLTTYIRRALEMRVS